jgi:hypothetical protein
MTENAPRPLGDLLKDITRKARPSQRALKGRRLAQKVFNDSFAQFAAHASVASVKVGVVIIEAESSAVFQELEAFHRQELLQVFRAAGLKVVEVRVKLASSQ